MTREIQQVLDINPGPLVAAHDSLVPLKLADALLDWSGDRHCHVKETTLKSFNLCERVFSHAF